MELDGQDAGADKFGKFELVEQIGHGGMATVHRAILRGMGGFKREVVIKRILPDLAKDEHFIKMFIEEAKLSALLDHPNIVQVYDFGVIDDHYYISMEFIDGATLLKLRKHFRRRRAFPPEAAALIIHQVCLGLDYTHRLTRNGQALGLVHRDVSPSNIMVSAHGEVKLLDFGIAKAVEAIDDELTRTGTLKGKWSYMSPEQVVGSQVTYRSDIFASGIVLWEVLSGRRLFKDKTDFLTLSNVANARVPPLTALRPELDPIFDAVCARALAKSPEERYVSAEEMADHLWTYVSEHPCTNSTLASLVAPMLADDTIELQTDMLQEISGSGSASTSSSVSVSGAEESMPESRESHTSLPRGEQEVILPRLSPGRRLITIATGGFVLATLLVVLLLVVLRPGDGPPKHDTPVAAGGPAAPPDSLLAGPPSASKPPVAKQPVQAAGPTSKPASQPEPPPPQKVTLHVDSSPQGALVRVKGEQNARGVTPLQLRIERSEKPLVLIASLPGHRPLQESVVPDRDHKLALALKPVEPPTAPQEPANPPTPVPAKVERPSRQPEQPGRRPPKRKGAKLPDLKSGDLADPYGD